MAIRKSMQWLELNDYDLQHCLEGMVMVGERRKEAEKAEDGFKAEVRAKVEAYRTDMPEIGEKGVRVGQFGVVVTDVERETLDRKILLELGVKPDVLARATKKSRSTRLEGVRLDQ